MLAKTAFLAAAGIFAVVSTIAFGVMNPSIFRALEEQLGLKVESGEAPIDVLVIDHIDHASDN